MVQLLPELTPATALLLFFVTNKLNFWMHFEFFFWGPKLLMFPKQKWNRNVGFTLCINNREASYKVERLCLYEDIGHVCLESNPSQVRCEHGTWEGTHRGDTNNVYIISTIIIILHIPAIGLVDVNVYFRAHWTLLVIHWIGVSVTFLVSPSVHLWGQMATPDDKGQAVVHVTWAGAETRDTTHVIGQQYNFGVCWLLLQTIKPIQYKQASTSWTKVMMEIRDHWRFLILSH